MKKILKVDRVSSLQEASDLQRLGADIITISLTPDQRFSDCRYVNKDIARRIKSTLTDSRLCCELELTEDCLKFIHDCRFDFVQYPGNVPLDPEIQRDLEKAGVGVIYSNIQASYDDDPNWILSPFEETLVICNRLFQIDLLPDIDNAWSFLKEESQKYDTELQVEDINNLASEFQLIISLDFTPDNIRSILTCFPNISGIALTLGENPTRNDVHWTDYDNLIAILQLLR